MKNRLIILLAFTLLFLIKFNAIAKPVTFIVKDESGRDNVSFTSDAPIELIVGRTTKITGEVTIDDSLDLKQVKPKVQFDVDLESIDTGIILRNEHMKDNFLETKKFPQASFIVNNVISSDYKLKDAKPVELATKGDFTVHGITVKKDIPVKVTYFKESDFTHNRFEHGDVIRIQSSFEIKLSEHKIKRPEAIFQKLADKVFVTVDAYANNPITKK